MVSIGKKFLYDIVVSDGLKLMEIQMICVDGFLVETLWCYIRHG